MDYKTIKKEASAQFTEQNSRFIGYIKPVRTEEEALLFIGGIKQKHWDATHNVYAYILREGIARYSDDKEPQGTAGIPALEALKKEGIVDVCVVVTRYFGGTLLGSGGLVRAYSKSARDAVNAAEIINMRLCKEIKIVCDYNLYGKMQNLVAEFDGKIENADFGETVTVNVAVTADNVGKFKEELLEISGGRAVSEIIGEKYININ